MELVKIANFIYDIENRYHSCISRLNFLKFNIWQIYRNFLVYQKLEIENSNGSASKNTLTVYSSIKKPRFIASWYKIIKQKKTLKGKIAICASSALYSGEQDGRRISYVLKSFEKAIGPGKIIRIITVTNKDSQDINGNTSPPIDINDSFLIVSPLLKKIIAIVFLPLELWHYGILKKFCQIKIREIARLLSGFFISYWFNYFFYLVLKPKLVIREST